MKYFLLALLSLLLSSCQKNKKPGNSEAVKHIPSIVDSLKTNSQVQEYLVTEVDTNLKGFSLPALKNLRIRPFKTKRDSIFHLAIKKYGITKNFYKADFDSNGYTDLLIIGGYGPDNENNYWYNSMVVMNNGKKPAKAHILGNELLNYTPAIVYKKNRPVIKVLGSKWEHIKQGREFKVIDKTLVWQQVGFAEENINPVEYDIEKIQFATSPCFGTCPIFEIHINKNREAIFLADAYNFSHEFDGPKEKKVFKATLTTETYSKLTDLINYLNFHKLKDNYAVGWTDSASATLIITYNNGKIKKIEDYGQQGTFGLMSLYTYFEELRFNQKWTETAEPKDIRINTCMKGLK